MTSSVYIHIPFCKSICSYCDFCKMFYNENLVDKYLNSLEMEIKNSYKNEKIRTIYIGGGTPSCLTKKQLDKLFEIIKLFDIDKNCEFSFESNISDITESMLKQLIENNVNRISIGIETVNPRFMKLLNRFNYKNMVIEKINLVKKYFDNFNLDLMYAFPNQNINEVLDDLDFIIKLEPKHISIYSLIIEEHTKIYIDGVKSIDEEIESSMYYNIINYLKKFNYNHYEISNFSKDGYQSKHNLVYWNNLEYYGFGLGASGFVSNIRYTNTRSINKYLDGNYIFEKEKILKSINMENEMIFGLRKIAGVNKKEFLKKYNINIYDNFDIIDLVDNNYLIDDGNNIFIPEDKLYVSNSILVNFLGGSKNE